MLESLLTLLIVGFYLVWLGIVSNPFTRSLKARKIKNEDVLLEINRELDYPLGGLGVFSYFSQGKDKVLVVFPKLTQDGDLEYIRSWYDLLDVIVHSLEETVHWYDFLDGIVHSLDSLENKKTVQQGENFDIMRQLTTPIQEHLQIEQDISKLQQQEEKIEQLLKLVSSSDLYSSQEELYDRALSQVQEMIDKASKLEQVYIRLIREVLIGKELSNYDPNQIVDNQMAMYSQYKKVKEEYQQLKDTATAYTELVKSDKL
jgi:hypothetical protein